MRRAINSHTLSRRQHLDPIAVNGKVLSFRPPPGAVPKRGPWRPWPTGTRAASALPLFCEEHDSLLFEPIDRSPFVGDPRQVLLLAYRSICHELYAKRSALDLFENAHDLDRGRQLPDQIELQRTRRTYIEGSRLGLQNIQRQKFALDSLLRSNDLDSFPHIVIDFAELSPLVCAGAFDPTHDVDANLLQDLSDPDCTVSALACALVPRERGSSLAIAWIESLEIMETFIGSLIRRPRSLWGDIATRIVLGHLENTYASPAWGASLQEDQWLEVSRLWHTRTPSHTRWLLPTGRPRLSWLTVENVRVVASNRLREALLDPN